MGTLPTSRTSAILLLSASLALGACAGPSRQTGSAAPHPGTILEVINRSSSDMDMFAVRTGTQARLGLAPSNKTTWFNILPGQLAGGGTVVFQARPLLGLARAISSDPVLLSPGDTVTLNIPPP